MGEEGSAGGPISCTFQGSRRWEREFRIYPCLGFTVSSDGKIVVEEGVLRDATVSSG